MGPEQGWGGGITRNSKCRHGWQEKENKEDDYMGRRMQVQKRLFLFFGRGRENLRIGMVRGKQPKERKGLEVKERKERLSGTGTLQYQERLAFRKLFKIHLK